MKIANVTVLVLLMEQVTWQVQVQMRNLSRGC